MKKHGILNSSISKVLSDMGHTDTICIGDCGLPIPKDVEKIDLAIRFGLPTFIEVVKEVSDDMKIEKITLAEEIKTKNPEVLNELKEIFPNIIFEFVNHEELKQQTKTCKAVIRTGENTPYANCILHSGVIF